jgi:hypothetical protein
MDQVAVVDGDANGLLEIMEAFKARGLPVEGVYLIVLTSDDGFVERIIRLVVPHRSHDLNHRMIAELVKLRRQGKLPRVDESVRFSLISADDPEADRVADYARRIGVPGTVQDVMWRGLFIEYALVAKVPQMAAA